MTRRRNTQRLSPAQWRWKRRRRSLATLAAMLVTASLLLAADRAGWFGSVQDGDLQRYHGRSFACVKVVDGDTLDIAAPDAGRPHTRIRLWGVDTPETVKPNTPVQHFGPEASRFTRDRAEGKTVRVELLAHDTRDKYGRLLAYVYLPDGTMLNEAIIAEGFGYADSRFEHRYLFEFGRAMRDARDARRGLWRDVQPTDLPYYIRR
jgi:micrococcal nuclease